ncbi:MAG: hypothetical protein WKF91_15845 [Segetibacter sp.]
MISSVLCYPAADELFLGEPYTHLVLADEANLGSKAPRNLRGALGNTIKM